MTNPWLKQGWGYARLRWEFQPRDLIVGVYWKRDGYRTFDLWLCLVPMLPLHLSWWNESTEQLRLFAGMARQLLPDGHVLYYPQEKAP